MSQQATQEETRQARLTSYPAPAGVNSMWLWHRRVSPWRVMWNFVIVHGCRYLPSLRVKDCLYRTLGIKVGPRVAPGLGVTMDVFFPRLISIGEDTIVGYNTVILAHEFLQRELRTGPVDIGKNVMIGANVTILPGVLIGDGATISACSLVNRDVPAGALVGGVPARVLKNADLVE